MLIDADLIKALAGGGVGGALVKCATVTWTHYRKLKSDADANAVKLKEIEIGDKNEQDALEIERNRVKSVAENELWAHMSERLTEVENELAVFKKLFADSEELRKRDHAEVLGAHERADDAQRERDVIKAQWELVKQELADAKTELFAAKEREGANKERIAALEDRVDEMQAWIDAHIDIMEGEQP
jgi:chromosome segregation ATPase